MKLPTVTINKRGAKRARESGHLWIYKSDAVNASGVEGGEVVRVADERGNRIGAAFYSDRSEITLRFLTFREVEINEDWWRERFRQAFERRRVYREHTNAFRLIYSEGDLLPSLIVDNYNGVFVMQNLSQGAERHKDLFVKILAEDFEPRAIVERNDARVRGLEGLELQNGVLYGDAPDEIEIEQDGIQFYVAPLGGQKTGAFLDQRENRLAIKKFAFGRALDCFTFNGGFALNLAQKCESVLAIDTSEEAIALAQRNAELNRIPNLKFEMANAFDHLRELEAAGEKYDTIVLDPPAFTKNRGNIAGAARGYKEINLRAFKLLNRNGVLATCTCSFHMSEAQFLATVEEAARDAGRRVQLIEKRTQASDHPILLNMPETHYLKCFVLRVLD